MATYGTDLITIADADTLATWANEFTPYSLGGTPALDGENYIQGVNCISQTTGTKTGLNFSIAYNAGADISAQFNTGDVILVWHFYAVGPNLVDYATGGLRVGIGSSLTALNSYTTGGSNFGRNPYGGWQNVAVDPTRTADFTDGGGNGGAWQYFGVIAYTINAISKGTPHAVDAIRRGRGEIWASGTTCNFSGMATYNDYNDVTNGYNRFGLFSYQNGIYLWKGLMNIGRTGGSASFSDSNKTIIIDDAAKTYLSFNKVQINNASTTVTWSNIAFVAIGTEAPGQFVMVDNATVSMDGCLFVRMDTFKFLSNASIFGTTFQACKSVTGGGGTFTNSKVLQSTVTGSTSAAFIWDETIDTNGKLDGMEFSKGPGSHHAIGFGPSIPNSITLRDITFSGFNAANNLDDSTLYFSGTTGTTTVNLVGCSGTITYATAGTEVLLVADPVTTEIITKDADTQNTISGVTVLCWVTDGSNFPYQDSVTITGSSTTAVVHHVGHGLNTNDDIWIEGVTDENYYGAYPITKINDDYYSYTTVDTITESPALGSPTATFCFLNGYTDALGTISDSRVVGVDQPIAYRARKSTTSPLYRGSAGTDTVDSLLGLTITVNLISDE